MRKAIARFFQFLFRLEFFKKRFYGFHKRVFRPISLFDGLKMTTKYDGLFTIQLDLSDWIQQHIFFLGYYDERGIRFLKNYLNEGDVFVDIGANMGSYTLVASGIVGDTGMVHAFEPVTDTFNQLEANLNQNKLQNVHPHRLAISDSEGSITMNLAQTQNTGMSSIYNHDNENGRTEMVRTTTLDAFAQENPMPKIDLIKLDIEGAELLALRGMEQTLRRFKPALMVEISNDVLKNTGIKPTELIDYLKTLNYTPYSISKSGDLAPFEMTSYENYIFLIK